jgi:hypothetical protein
MGLRGAAVGGGTEHSPPISMIFGRRLVCRCYRQAKQSFGLSFSLRTLSSGETFIWPFISSTEAIVGQNTHPAVYVINPAIVERNSRVAATCGGKLAITAFRPLFHQQLSDDLPTLSLGESAYWYHRFLGYRPKDSNVI